MLKESKNLKDMNSEARPDMSSLASDDLSFRLTYSKTNKLITALYMVTDIMDREEPIRFKLRTLGTEIISDTYCFETLKRNVLADHIDELMSFFNIASGMGMISEMNCAVLSREFAELKQSIRPNIIKDQTWLEKFLLRPSESLHEGGIHLSRMDLSEEKFKYNGQANANVLFNKGQGFRIGVQRGSTLLKALDNIQGQKDFNKSKKEDYFKRMKDKRREEIVIAMKDKKRNNGMDGATITDIKNRSKGILLSCQTKTLQRELISMVSDNILYRTGSKRWSKYFLK